MHAITKSVWSSICLTVLGYSATAFGLTAPAQNLKLQFTDPSVQAVAGGQGLVGAQGQYVMPYNLYLPANYDPAGPALPVVIFLHGAGERGTDNNAQVANYLNGLISNTQGATGNRAIVIAPQCPQGQVWNSINSGDQWQPSGSGKSYYSETPTQQAARSISPALQVAMDLLNNIQTTKNVNSNKVYITGLSMGGFGTWDAITRFPGKFAAAMPMSGGGNVLAAPALVNEPIWAYHGTLDTIVTPNGSTQVIDAIRSNGGTKAITTLPAEYHQGWGVFLGDNPTITYRIGQAPTTGGTDLYNNSTLYPWLFAQAVPEPSSLGLLILGGAALLARRSKKG